MKMVMHYLRMQKSKRDDKDTFPISSMVKGGKIPEGGTESVVRVELICERLIISTRARLKRP